MEGKKKKEFVVYATTMDSYNGFYGSIVMEILNPLVSTVIVHRTAIYCIILLNQNKFLGFRFIRVPYCIGAAERDDWHLCNV